MYVIFTNNSNTYREALKNGDQVFKLDTSKEKPRLALNQKDDQKDESPEKKIVKEISILLKRIGISPNLKGYHYLLATFINYWKDPDFAKNGLTKELYPRIGKEFSTTGSRVERAIRHAVNVAWLRGDIELIHELFGYCYDPNKSNPTNGEFISSMLSYLKENVF